jgi:hypothetical protein
MARLVERFDSRDEHGEREDGFRYRAPVEEEEINRLSETVELEDGRRATRTREWGVRRFGRYVPVPEHRGVLARLGDALLAVVGLGLLLVFCALGFALAGWWGFVAAVLAFAALGSR